MKVITDLITIILQFLGIKAGKKLCSSCRKQGCYCAEQEYKNKHMPALDSGFCVFNGRRDTRILFCNSIWGFVPEGNGCLELTYTKSLYDNLSDVLVAYSDALRKAPVDQRGDIVIGYVLDDHEVKWWQEERNYEIDLLGKTESKTYSAQNQHAYRRKHCKHIIAEAIGESLADRLFDFDKSQLKDSVISDLKNNIPEEIQALKGLKDQSLLSPYSTHMSKPVLGPMKNIMTTRRNFRDGRSVTTYKYLKTEENTKLNWCWIMTDIQQLFSLLALICLSMMLRYGSLRAIAGEFAVLLKSRENCSRSYTDFKKYRALSATYLNIHRQNVYFSAQELALLECFWTLLSELYTPRYTLNIEDYIALPKIERLLSCLHSLTAIDPQAELAFNTHGKALLYLPSQGGIREEYMRLITEVLSLA